jgi:hypothetical protein
LATAVVAAAVLAAAVLAAAVVAAAGNCATLPAATVGGVEEAVPASSEAARVHAVPTAQITRNMQGNFVIDL